MAQALRNGFYDIGIMAQVLRNGFYDISIREKASWKRFFDTGITAQALRHRSGSDNIVTGLMLQLRQIIKTIE